MKKTRATYSSNVKLVAVFVAGLVVATLGWYYSDRLNIAFGRSADIDVIKTHEGSSPIDAIGAAKNRELLSTSDCIPGTKTHEIRELMGCDLVTKSVSCMPVQRYINVIKTRHGTNWYESSTPKRRSQPITKYETKVDQKIDAIGYAYSDAKEKVEEYRHGKTAQALSQDEHHKELVAKLAEIKSLHDKVDRTVCPPGLRTR